MKQCVAVDHNLMRVQCSVEKYNMMGCSTLLYNRSLEEKSQENKSTIFHQNTCNVMKLYKFLAVHSWSDGCCTKALLTLGAAGMDDAATVLIYSKIDAIKGDAFFYQKLNFSPENTV